MRVLFVHQSFPGQFRNLVKHLVSHNEFEVAAIADARSIAGRDVSPYRITVHAYEHDGPIGNRGSIQDRITRGRTVESICEALHRDGYRPDVVVAHPGWGEAMFLRDVFPDTPLLLYCEVWPNDAALRFDAEFEASDSLAPSHAAGALLSMDRGVAPTHWQRSMFPPQFIDRIDVIHDGIDTDVVHPQGETEAELITYVSRNLEPYRGFHTFMRAIPEIQRRRPSARIVIVGGDKVSYSPRLPEGQTYRQRMLKELGERIDLARVQFTGPIPYPEYLQLLQRSAVHVYLTYPFVLSWSMLEAMSAGCLVVGSKTPPVEEVIRDGENGLLVDFFSPAAIAEKVDQALGMDQRALRDRARSTVLERYDLKRVCLPAQMRLIEGLVGTH